MSDENFGGLGSLYRKIGMNPAPDLIQSRIESSKKIYAEVELESLAPLLRGAFGIAKKAELSFISDTISADDPSYSSEDGCREIELLSAGILRRALSEGGEFSAKFALGIVVASFGSVRSTMDESLVASAERVLLEYRTTKRPLPEKVANKARPNWAADFESMQAMADASQFKESFPVLKKLLEGGPAYTSTFGASLVGQLNALLENQRLLMEQMNVHWWVLGAWNIDGDVPFSEFQPAESGLRAGMDLASLTTASGVGLFAAPALLRRALGGAVSEVETNLKELAVCGSREWREKWSGGLLQKPEIMSLLPICGAACLAIDSDEQPDWEPRYQRQFQINASSPIGVVDAANQIYLEQLLLREVLS